MPVLLVDGYNVCGYWMKLKKHFANGRLDIARQKLIDELVTFSMLRGSYLLIYFSKQQLRQRRGCQELFKKMLLGCKVLLNGPSFFMILAQYVS